MSQETRNKIYALGAALAGVLVIAGVVDQASSDVALGLFDNGLEVATSVAFLATNVLAFVKSLRSKVTVIDVPKADVLSVNTLGGTLTADGRHEA